MLKKKNVKTREEVLWNKFDRKLMVYVIEVNGILLSKGCHLRFLYGKQKFKTLHVSSNDIKTVFNDLFFFSVEGSMELLIELVTTNKMGIEKVIGICSMDRPIDYKEEMLVDIEFQINPKSKKGNDKFNENVLLRMRYIYSEMAVHDIQHRNRCCTFHYYKIKNEFKTGDLILFNETGMISTIQKLLDGNNHFSRVGMVVELPNKWTHKKKKYIFEMFPNFEMQNDNFLDTPIIGFNLFKLKERLHSFYGSQIWWSPLTEPLDPVLAENVQEFITKLHNGKEDYTNFISDIFPDEMMAFIGKTEGTSYNRLNQVDAFKGSQSVRIIMEILKIGGKRIPSQNRYYFPSELFEFDILNAPVLLRKLRKDDDPDFDPRRDYIRKEKRNSLETLTQRVDTPKKQPIPPQKNISEHAPPTHQNGSYSRNTAPPTLKKRNTKKLPKNPEQETKPPPPPQKKQHPDPPQNMNSVSTAPPVQRNNSTRTPPPPLKKPLSISAKSNIAPPPPDKKKALPLLNSSGPPPPNKKKALPNPGFRPTEQAKHTPPLPEKPTDNFEDSADESSSGVIVINYSHSDESSTDISGNSTESSISQPVNDPTVPVRSSSDDIETDPEKSADDDFFVPEELPSDQMVPPVPNRIVPATVPVSAKTELEVPPIPIRIVPFSNESSDADPDNDFDFPDRDEDFPDPEDDFDF